MIDEIRCNLLRSRKNYIRDSEINSLLNKLDSQYIRDFLNIEYEIHNQEEVLYNLLHRKIKLGGKLESLVRKNMTFTQE